MLLDLLSGEETERTRLDMVRRRPMPFPPEPVAALGIHATRWSLDRADHRQGRRNLLAARTGRDGAGLRLVVHAGAVRSPIPDYLDEVLRACAPDTSGAVADYIPELARVDPSLLGLCVSTVDGAVYEAGDTRTDFTIQSISKPFVYALALAERGLDAVLAEVDVEPSGEAFDELSLEQGSGRPLNPMINAGALVVHTLVGDPDTRFERILAGLSAFAGHRLEVDEAAYRSETETAFRNYAIANMLRSHGTIREAPEQVVVGYTRQCAVRVTARDLALMAATLANGGINPLTGEQVVDEDVVRQTLSVMATSGMYDAAGDWTSTVGFPAKSGVSGGDHRRAARPARDRGVLAAAGPPRPQRARRRGVPPALATTWGCT